MLCLKKKGNVVLQVCYNYIQNDVYFPTSRTENDPNTVIRYDSNENFLFYRGRWLLMFSFNNWYLMFAKVVISSIKKFLNAISSFPLKLAQNVVEDT
jgi:hypothetical protein